MDGYLEFGDITLIALLADDLGSRLALDIQFAHLERVYFALLCRWSYPNLMAS